MTTVGKLPRKPSILVSWSPAGHIITNCRGFLCDGRVSAISLLQKQIVKSSNKKFTAKEDRYAAAAKGFSDDFINCIRSQRFNDVWQNEDGCGSISYCYFLIDRQPSNNAIIMIMHWWYPHINICGSYNGTLQVKLIASYGKPIGIYQIWHTRIFFLN